MNNDLISRDALMLNAEQYRCGRNEYSRMVDVWHIENAPAVDAVEVVRCKDCKWYKRGIVFKDEMFCFRPEANGVPVISLYKDDDFCSYGERREDG